MWPVFNGGKIHANIRAKEEETSQAYLTYKKTVLAAPQETEDAIDRYAASQQAFVALRQSAATAQSSDEQAYAQNLVSLYKALGGGWQQDSPGTP